MQPEQQASVVYISLPGGKTHSIGNLVLDPAILLPLDQPPGAGLFPEDITEERILAGILKLLAWEPEHQHIAYYRQLALAIRPDLPLVLSDAALVKASAHQYDLAWELFLALQGLEPDNVRHQLNMALLCHRRAEYHRQMGNEPECSQWTQEARERYQALLSGECALPELFLHAGLFCLFDNDEIPAGKLLEQYSTMVPAEKQPTEIRTLLRNLGAIKSSTRYRSAMELIQSGREREGIALMQDYLAVNEQSWNGWFLLGWGHRRLGEMQQARDAFAKADKLHPGSPDILNELSICSMELGNLDECEAYLKQALLVEPQNTKVMSNLAILHLKLGNRDYAEEFFEQVLALDPDDPVAKSFFGL